MTSVDGLKCLILCFCFDCACYTMGIMKDVLWIIKKERQTRIIILLWQKLMWSELNNKNTVVKIECDCNTISAKRKKEERKRRQKRLYNVPVKFPPLQHWKVREWFCESFKCVRLFSEIGKKDHWTCRGHKSFLNYIFKCSGTHSTETGKKSLLLLNPC